MHLYYQLRASHLICSYQSVTYNAHPGARPIQDALASPDGLFWALRLPSNPTEMGRDVYAKDDPVAQEGLYRDGQIA
jgi:hypothetical protein